MQQLDRSTIRELARTHGVVKNGCKIRATNDIEALERWLDEYFDKPTTFRSYKKEGERFLVWCTLARTTTLAALMRDDVEAYLRFLKDPQPRALWCGPRRKKEVDGQRVWYPFAGPLSDTAIKACVAILTSFMNFLVDANYITHNPFALIRRKSRFKHNFDENAIHVHERILSHDEWRAFLDTVTQRDDRREQFIIKVFYFLGVRVEEFARARWRDFKRVNGKWWFFVCGKNDRLGKIPVNSELLHAIMAYRNHLGMTPLPELDDDAHLLKGARDNEGLSSRQISNIIKAIAKSASDRFVAGSTSREKLRCLSPHWLRHLSASRQDLAGISFTNIKSNLRHENEQTTRIYVHAYDDERHREMEKLSL